MNDVVIAGVNSSLLQFTPLSVGRQAVAAAAAAACVAMTTPFFHHHPAMGGPPVSFYGPTPPHSRPPAPHSSNTQSTTSRQHHIAPQDLFTLHRPPFSVADQFKTQPFFAGIDLFASMK